MSSSQRNVLCLVVGIVAGLLIAGLLSGPGAWAQPAQPPERPEAPGRQPGGMGMGRGMMGMMPRYQVSAYPSGGRAGQDSGCYIVDTTTGETWVVDGNGSPTKIGQKLAR